MREIGYVYRVNYSYPDRDNYDVSAHEDYESLEEALQDAVTMIRDEFLHYGDNHFRSIEKIVPEQEVDLGAEESELVADLKRRTAEFVEVAKSYKAEEYNLEACRKAVHSVKSLGCESEELSTKLRSLTQTHAKKLEKLNTLLPPKEK